jgi:hypothetical protein
VLCWPTCLVSSSLPPATPEPCPASTTLHHTPRRACWQQEGRGWLRLAAVLMQVRWTHKPHVKEPHVASMLARSPAPVERNPLQPAAGSKAAASKPMYSSGQKFGQTMDVSQGCKQAEHQVAIWSTWLHAVMPAPHSHGCRLRVSLRAGTWQSLQNCNFTAKNRPVFASICSTQQ